MFASRFALLLAFLFASSTLGLKGGRVRSRALQDTSGPKGSDADIFTTAKDEKDSGKDDKDDKDDKGDKTTDKKDDKADKKDDKKDKDKKDKKDDKKDKKCKERKEKKDKAPASETVDQDVSLDAKQLETETPEPKEAEKYCEDPSIKKSGDCTKLKGGELPAESDKLGGKLTMELTTADEANALSEMQKVLKDETTLSAVGCEAQRRLQDVTETDNSTEPEIALMAFEIGELFNVGDECENSELENGTMCSHVTSTVLAHYSGNASADQQQALFDSFTNTLQDQIASGRFSDVADVHYVDVAVDDGLAEEDFNASAKTNDGGGAPVGGIIGGLVAAIALVAAGGYAYVKKPFKDTDCGDCGPSAVVPGERAVVQVLSDDVEIMNARAY